MCCLDGTIKINAQPRKSGKAVRSELLFCLGNKAAGEETKSAAVNAKISNGGGAQLRKHYA